MYKAESISSDVPVVAVIGGGASGALTATHVLWEAASRAPIVAAAWVEPDTAREIEIIARVATRDRSGFYPDASHEELAEYLNARAISAVRFIPVSFTPSSSVYAGQLCQGVNVVLLDRNTLDAPELGIELASALHKLYPNDFKMERIAELLVNQATFDALMAGQDPRRIAEGWREALEKFGQMRGKYLLYK